MVITVFLLRNHIARLDDAIDSSVPGTLIAGAAALPFQCRLFLGHQQSHPPDWYSFIGNNLIHPLPNRAQSGVSAVLVLEASGRKFAVTFGRGRFLLASGSIEDSFGLKVALNRVDDNDLKSIDTRTYDEIVTSSKIQLSRDASIENFGVDIARDILRAVQGKARDPLFANKLAGSDGLSISRNGLGFQDLGTLCTELLVAHGEKTYQAKFKWVDNVRQVRDAAEISALDTKLINAINANSLGNMHLTLHDAEEEMKIAAFRFTGSGSGEFPELQLSAYRQNVSQGRNGALSIGNLKQHRIKVRYSGATDFEPYAFVYESLVWETTIGAESYALFDGLWFKIDGSFAADVKAYWQNALGTPVPMPDGQVGEDEADYNARVARGSSAFMLFDKVRLLPSSGTQVEFCDLFSDQGHIIHVKRRHASATFSHLFSQGTVSAETFLLDKTYRRRALSAINNAGKISHVGLMPSARPDANLYHVVYAILATTTTAPNLLPFFSAVNFRQHAQRLATMGIKTSLQHVPVR